MTKARSAVLAVLEQAEFPLTAALVHERLPLACDQATVYRTLHWLETHAQAESFVLNCTAHGTERWWVSLAQAHRHWFHCEHCHSFTDLGLCRLGPLLGELESARGIRIHRHILYCTGLCRTCAADAPAVLPPADSCQEH